MAKKSEVAEDKWAFSEKVLLAQIGIKRKIMYRKAKTFEFTHPIVVECSQELDFLINKYQL